MAGNAGGYQDKYLLLNIIFKFIRCWHQYCSTWKRTPKPQAGNMEKNSQGIISGIKILLIERQAVVEESLLKISTDNGNFLTTVRTAEEGLRLVKKNQYDVIISEFDLPGINGLDFFTLDPVRHCGCAKVLIAGYGDVDPVSRAHAVGIGALLEKPFPLVTLIDTLKRLLKEKKP
jgi:DNA-binding NtrC family response regulator